MTRIEVMITQTLHVHGMTMDAAVARAIKRLCGEVPSRVEIIARYVDDEDSS